MNIINAYCTLFDSNYADKGLVMIQSLRVYDKVSPIFVLCMDDLCFEILSSEKISNVEIIKLDDFVDDDLRKLQEIRGKGEFCWSCTGKLIKYVLINYGPRTCTYVDSDLLFYSDPIVLINEMHTKNCSVQVVPHRFPNTRRWRKVERTSGKNCVQFNTFSDSQDSMELLDHWITQCINKCDKYSGGDQIYTSNWGEIKYVNISQNEGAGLAPWNVEKYKLSKNNNIILNRKTNKQVDLVFYHFQGLEYLDRYRIYIRLRNRISKFDQSLIDYLYIPYLICLEKMKQMLKEKYGVVPMYSHSSGLFGDECNPRNLKAIISDLIEKRNVKKDTYDISDYI